MEYKIVLILLVLGAAIFSGCVGNTVTGKYVYEKDNRSYYVFYPNGEFNAFGSDGGSASGTYRIENNEFILTYRPFGNVIKLKKEGDVLVDKDGDRYIKTKTEG